MVSVRACFYLQRALSWRGLAAGPRSDLSPALPLRYEARRAGTWSEWSRRGDLSETNGRGALAGSYKQHQRREKLGGGCRRHGNGISATCGCEQGPPTSSWDGVERKKCSSAGFTPASARTEHKGSHLQTSHAQTFKEISGWIFTIVRNPQ